MLNKIKKDDILSGTVMFPWSKTRCAPFWLSSADMRALNWKRHSTHVAEFGGQMEFSVLTHRVPTPRIPPLPPECEVFIPNTVICRELRFNNTPSRNEQPNMRRPNKPCIIIGRVPILNNYTFAWSSLFPNTSNLYHQRNGGKLVFLTPFSL